MKFLNILLSALALLSAQVLAAQSFTADAPSSVNINDYFHLRYRVSSTGATDFTPPSLADFEILAGPSVSRSSSFQMVNGKTSTSETTTYTYVLSPRKNGRFTIGPATVTAGGTTLHSNSVTLTVSGTPSASAPSAPSQPRQQEEPIQAAGSRVTDRDLYITVTPSRTSVYEQEAVLLTYRVYSRVGVGLSNVVLSQKPDFKGLVSQEIPVKSIQTHLESVGGVSYRAGTILQDVVFPQQSGRLDIPSVTFTCTVAQRQSAFEDPLEAFFNSGGGTVGVQVERTVRPAHIDVKALPAPRPANFSGGVGRFSLKGELTTPVPKSNDVATYRITVSGTGNLKLLTPPRLVFPTDFDTYEPKTTEQTETTASGLTGEVAYDYTFVPRNVGKYVVPAAEFVFFNPSTGQYETLRTAPLTLDVTQGERTNADVERELQLRNSDIVPMKKGETPADEVHPFWWGTWTYWLANAALLLAVLAALRLLDRHLSLRADVAGRKRRRAGRVATKRMKRAAMLLKKGTDADFYDEVARALQGYLADKFGLSQAEMSAERIEQLLSQPEVPFGAAAKFSEALSRCEYARFAPSAEADGKARLYGLAVAAIDQMEK